MSKRGFKSQASSSRAAAATFGAFASASTTSSLSYLIDSPDLTSLSDANLVVAFKNLTKKDATTKAKALEDLRAYVQAHPYESSGGPEDGALEAWVKLYPRLSIDDSRRVRELSHIIQFELLKSTRRRMEKHIPKIVGTWLAGTFDRDRGVARSAVDGLASFLDTEVKMTAFWKRCQSEILQYANDAFNETPQTLSDERTVGADVMQEKYFRVIGSSVSLVLNLLVKLSSEDISKFQDDYETFLSKNKTLWKLASCEDSVTRKAVDQLMVVCLTNQPALIDADLKIFSHSFISEALIVAQQNSAIQLLQALSALTTQFPEIWTSAYKSSKPPLSKLRRFVERGSQGAPPEYWSLLESTLLSVPEAAIVMDWKAASSFLEAFRAGATSREEPRGNATYAWQSYFHVCRFVLGRISKPQHVEALLSEAVYPTFDHYLQNTAANAKWPTNIRNVAEAYTVCFTATVTQPVQKWKDLSEEFITRLQTSLPEQSKDFQKSQTSVSAQGNRWFELYGSIENLDLLEPLKAPTRNIIDTALKVMTSRQGKPYSAASTLESGFRHASPFLESDGILESIKKSLEDNILTLVLSPSSQYAISILLRIGSLPNQNSFLSGVWQETINKLLNEPQEPSTLNAINNLITNDRFTTFAHSHESLQEFIYDATPKAILGDSQFWTIYDSAIRFNTATNETSRRILENALEHLNVNQSNLDGPLRILESSSKKADLLHDQTLQISLLAKLLALTELADSDIALRATSLRAAIEKIGRQPNKYGTQDSPIVHVIKENLESASNHSLAVDTLIQQAQLLVETTDDASVLTSLFVATTHWSNSLQQLFQLPINPALGVMRPFAGLAFLTIPTASNSNISLSQDSIGYTAPLRIAMYTASLLLGKAFRVLPRQRRTEVLHLLCLTAELLSDQLDLLENGKLFFIEEGLENVEDIREFLAKVQAEFRDIATNSRSWRRNKEDAILDDYDSSPIMHELVFLLLESSEGSTSEAYYSSKALGHLLTNLIDAHGWQLEGGDEWLTKIDILKSSTTNHLGAVGLLVGLGEDLDTSKLANNLCNRLISDIAGVSAQSQKTLPLLVLLNSSLAIYDEGDLPVAQNRVVFAVKQILGWTPDLASSNPRLASEACRALQKLLPAIKGVYGSYWEVSLSFCVSIWESSLTGYFSDQSLPMIGMALKLYQVLKTLEDANDDLVDVLVESKDRISKGLLGLLKLKRSVNNQPMQFVDGILSRMIMQFPSQAVGDPSELYPLVASDFTAVQSAAYDLLSSTLPEIQRELSVNVLLENTDARLPEELLSLLLDAPSIRDFSDNDLDEFPGVIRGYLLSWHLVFSSYPTASHKVRNDYTEHLKSENYITPLLDFLFDSLGHSASKPLNLDRARFSEVEIKSYRVWDASNTESSERNFQWLLLHLYYLALKYTPNLVKAWWLDCKSKQTRNAVESWTEKYFASLVVQDVLDGVAQWADEQEEPVGDEKNLVIKVGRKTREIYAGYEIDDMMVQIVIRLPSNYPLEGIKVEGVNRVAASEAKWRSWLMITQGAITFSNGSITDGLLIFRKNVIGALKGQTECAICYSIVSPDKKMPDKRCLTCKNMFHSACLFKWFASSNQNSCPLCRNPFDYGRRLQMGALQW